MATEPNETFVDSNTDDLDAFSSLLNGNAKEQPVETPKEDPVEVEDEIEEEVENQDQDTDTEEEADESPKPDDKPKKNRFQERINELTAKAKEAERALDALKAEQAKPKEAVQQTPVVRNNEPQPNETNTDGTDKYPLGEFDPQYIRDVARHTMNIEWAAHKEQEARDNQAAAYQNERNQLQTQWVGKMATVAEKHDDFLDKTVGLESTFEGLDDNYADYLVQTIKTLDHGPEVLYYFANHLDEAKKFVSMGPLAATLALGEYNSMFKGQTRQSTKVSKAPPPPQVNKGSKTTKAVSADTDDLDAFSALLFKR